ncbi:hypothetical protein J2Z70_005022 [Paenibacillus silagei]|uniref:Uncharacterized protein n=1 Tax=Paenibacillus silagei TaxID=1670801 RepID=A0ABS4NXP3_9BACL|nr:hypothetical protein [Paenibacillus silagei]
MIAFISILIIYLSLQLGLIHYEFFKLWAYAVMDIGYSP